MSVNTLKLFTAADRLDYKPNENAVIIAELKDSNNRPLSGMEIKWNYVQDDNAKVTTSGKSSQTDSNGQATYTLSGTSSDSISVTATAVCGGTDTIYIGVESANLTAPSITPSAVRGDAYDITVPRHVKRKHKGDEYMVYWGSHQIKVVTDTDAPDEFPVIISVSENAEYLKTGTNFIYYIIRNEVGNMSFSPVATEKVPLEMSAPLGDKPLFPDLPDARVNNHGLSLDKGLLIKIPYPQSKATQGAVIEAGDTISVYMRICTSYDDDIADSGRPEKIVTYTVSKQDIYAKNIEFTADKSYFIDNVNNDDFNGVYVFIYYMLEESLQAFRSHPSELYVNTDSPGNYIVKLIV
ncbi:TPA: Ig-like domain-containing protein [Salmonella enterica subsp. enterica serovar Thompson]